MHDEVTELKAIIDKHEKRIETNELANKRFLDDVTLKMINHQNALDGF